LNDSYSSGSFQTRWETFTVNPGKEELLLNFRLFVDFDVYANMYIKL
jgi:hypothetical protein